MEEDSLSGVQLLPLLYSSLRKLAGRYLAGEKPGQSLTPTALVHEAFLRLVNERIYESRGHFYVAASQAMRRILIERARQRKRIKHGGGMNRIEVDIDRIASPTIDEQLLALDEALKRFAETNPRRGQVVELRFFGGLTLPEIAEFLEISLSTADRDWKYARAWLYEAMGKR